MQEVGSAQIEDWPHRDSTGGVMTADFQFGHEQAGDHGARVWVARHALRRDST